MSAPLKITPAARARMDKILELLERDGELRQESLAYSLRIHQGVIRILMRDLTKEGLVSYEQRGKERWWSVTQEKPNA